MTPDAANENDSVETVADETIATPEQIEHEWLKELPEEVVAWLVRAVGARDLWKWLNEDEHLGLCRAITRGFQFNPQALRQPIVRVRLTKHLLAHLDELAPVVEIWLQTAPEIVPIIDGLTDDELIEQLPRLWQRFGGEALILTLARARRERALEALETIDEAVAALEDAPENTSEDAEQVLAAPASVAPDLESVVARLKQQLEDARNHSDALLKTLAQAQEMARKTSEKLRLEVTQAQRQHKALERQAQTSQTQLSETQKNLDRTARRLRHLEKEHEDTASENKRVRRQMRHQQEISENLRKEIAQLKARLETFEPKTETVAPPPVAPVAPKTPKPSPLDTPYVWKSDGQNFRISPRDVQRRVDANDEEWVFRLIQALDALREIHPDGYKRFLDALRDLDPYYGRVLSADTTRVLVDASNVARYEKNQYGKGQIRHLLAMREELRRRNCFPIHFIADASLPHNIDRREELLLMASRGEIEMTRVGQEADEILAREARRSGAFVVTNDRNFFQKVTPDFEPPRISFRILDGFLIVDDF